MDNSLKNFFLELHTAGGIQALIKRHCRRKDSTLRASTPSEAARFAEHHKSQACSLPGERMLRMNLERNSGRGDRLPSAIDYLPIVSGIRALVWRYTK